jgi:hypothetical protein
MVEENGLAAKRRKQDALTPALSHRERGKSFAHLALFRGHSLLPICKSLPLTIQ